ncbi:GDP-mannose 4,6-dehydratase [Marinobacter bryozoorum]|uniref:GDP-mannose 4,6-dehydratase n=1 Tax=Marinobacter bryozoorum TaxID=256324 RepID=UPI0020060CF3|nr:GDP-mannose 4,6-dehydratase [Marinobacter bryozoorum]MCK7542787.1 GDP-mannose 4,6-dehydratase [Marinobacter bryozoorum]
MGPASTTNRQGPVCDRVLITGIHGFTGRYLERELVQAGYRVYGTSSEPTDSPGCYQVDLREPEQLAAVIRHVRPQAVIHLAALAFVAHGSPEDFYHVNLLGTRNLLQALADSGHDLHRVILASSANVYGNSRGGMLDEDTPPAPANDYAVSKLAMEHMARLWQDTLPITIVRPFNYTGAGQPPHFLVPKIVEHFRRREPVIELGNLDVVRDFNDVRAVAQAYRGLLEVDAGGQTVNIGSGKGRSLEDIIAICERHAGYDIEVRVNPAFVRANEVKTLVGDISRLQSLLPQWQPVALEETLAWMLQGGESAR